MSTLEIFNRECGVIKTAYSNASSSQSINTLLLRFRLENLFRDLVCIQNNYGIENRMPDQARQQAFNRSLEQLKINNRNNAIRVLQRTLFYAHTASSLDPVLNGTYTALQQLQSQSESRLNLLKAHHSNNDNNNT